ELPEMSVCSYEVSDGIATITLDRPKSFNALTFADYDAFASALYEIDKREDVVVTVWQGACILLVLRMPIELILPVDAQLMDHGSARTDTSTAQTEGIITQRDFFATRIAKTNTACTHALSSHTKVLVAALNGPVMGELPQKRIAAGHFDFIYCMPKTFLCVGFPLLGVIAEAGSSTNFIARMGVARANEVLLFGKKLDSQALLECGFVNKIFPDQPAEAFHRTIRAHLQAELKDLVPDAILGSKKLLKIAAAERNNPDAVNLRESMAQAARFATGVPMARFAKIASKEIRHKL
ncbi:hypothetical protein EIP91_004077, partial [Steccherinum ochraceum]